MDKLHEIAQVLLQKEVITAEEFESFFEGKMWKILCIMKGTEMCPEALIKALA